MGNAPVKGTQQKNRGHKKYVHWDQAGKKNSSLVLPPRVIHVHIWQESDAPAVINELNK